MHLVSLSSAFFSNPMKYKIKFLSFLSMGLGAFGMLYTLQFLYSNNLVDVVGAGLPFVGGSILFGAGLISLSINSN
jgi:hypothetical protein